jgi:hypothetical protein
MKAKSTAPKAAPQAAPKNQKRVFRTYANNQSLDPMPGEQDQEYLPMHIRTGQNSNSSGFDRFGW